MCLLCVENMYFVNVSKAYNNASGRYATRRKSKNGRFAYFYDEDQKIHRQRITKFEYFIFKYLKTKYKKNKFCCETCGNTFTGIIKKHKDQIECPYCNE